MLFGKKKNRYRAKHDDVVSVIEQKNRSRAQDLETIKDKKADRKQEPNWIDEMEFLDEIFDDD